MGIFDKLFRNKKNCCCTDTKESNCSCEKNINISTSDLIEIRILGPGCKNCQTLEKNMLEAVKELKLKVKVDHITDFSEIAKYGIMSTPGLWINGKIVSYGKVLTKNEIKSILEKL